MNDPVQPEPAPPPSPGQVEQALRRVVDPEVGLNVVDLGLIHEIRVECREVSVTMTLTTAGCPLQEALVLAVRTVVRRLPGVEKAGVRLVWDPPWSPERISPAGRAFLASARGG